MPFPKGSAADTVVPLHIGQPRSLLEERAPRRAGELFSRMFLPGHSARRARVPEVDLRKYSVRARQARSLWTPTRQEQCPVVKSFLVVVGPWNVHAFDTSKSFHTPFQPKTICFVSGFTPSPATRTVKRKVLGLISK